MRIGIDVRKINDTGIGRYIENLVESLLAVDRENHYVLFFAPGEDGERDYPEGRVTKIVESAAKYSIAEHWSLAQKAATAHVDVFHAPHYILPLFMKAPAVVTVHDLIHIAGPGFGPLSRAYARFMINSAVSRARVVIAVSEHTKNDIVSILGAPPGKIMVIPNGGGADFARPPEDETESALKALGLSRGYFLFVGSDRPHKNLGAVAKVMEMLGDDARFVIVGRTNDPSRRAFEKFGERARFLDNVGKKTMRALYSGAAALLFPSYYEGFGLPPLEAMACGTPVVASNKTSIPEVVGDAAALADPDDHRGMAAFLGRIRRGGRFRDELVAKGRERASLFSWEKTALMTLEAYRAAAR